MKILTVAPYVPYPPNSGGRIRVWEVIKFLGRRNEMTVAAFEEPGDAQFREALESRCERVVLVRREGPPRIPDAPLPLPVLWYHRPEMEAALRQLASECFDVVLLEQVYMAGYGRLFSDSVVVLCEQNIESKIYRQLSELSSVVTGTGPRQSWVQRATSLHLATYEDRMWPSFPLRVVVSEGDRAEVERRCTVGRTIVVENGIDVDSIRLLPVSRSRRLLFMGTLNYDPNADAALHLVGDIMPHVWERDPSVSAVIAGRDPPPQILALDGDPRVEVIANPPDMSTVAERCSAVVVPLRAGGGTRIKVLHAMAMGLPVVSTRRGAEGLDVADDRDLLLAEEPREFAAAVLRLLDDASLRQRLRAAGRALVESRYAWPRVVAPLESALESLASQASRNPDRIK